MTGPTVGNPSGSRSLCRPQRPGRGRLYRYGFLPYRFPKIVGGPSVPPGYGPLALRQNSRGLWYLSSHKTRDTLRQRPRRVHRGRAGQDRLDEDLRTETATRQRRDSGGVEEAHCFPLSCARECSYRQESRAGSNGKTMSGTSRPSSLRGQSVGGEAACWIGAAITYCCRTRAP